MAPFCWFGYQKLPINNTENPSALVRVHVPIPPASFLQSTDGIRAMHATRHSAAKNVKDLTVLMETLLL
jgi:hypothetical protein